MEMIIYKSTTKIVFKLIKANCKHFRVKNNIIYLKIYMSFYKYYE